MLQFYLKGQLEDLLLDPGLWSCFLRLWTEAISQGSSARDGLCYPPDPSFLNPGVEGVEWSIYPLPRTSISAE